MSTCSLTQNILNDCRQAIGGIKSIFVTNLSNQSVLPTVSGGTVTAYSLTAGSGAKFFQYSFRKATGEWNETQTLSDSNWTIYFSGDLKIQFTKMEVVKQQELFLLGQQDLILIILDNNGTYWLQGYTNGASLSKIDQKSGKGFGDLNGYSIEIKYLEPKPALVLPASFITTLTTPA